jgi:hypothetical protein
MRINEHDPVANSGSAFVDQALNPGLMEAGKRDFAQRSQEQIMLIKYGYELTLNCPQPTMVVCLLARIVSGRRNCATKSL